MEYYPNPRFHPNAPKEILTARARRLVVVSGGPFGSPSILERSGIGAAKVLQEHGVTQIVDLPNVGENYQGTCVDDRHTGFLIKLMEMLQTIRLSSLLTLRRRTLSLWTVLFGTIQRPSRVS